ncbi:hypothetical protein GFY24_20610 [Nocardia sp. SYP-A9097]|uniref:DoxX family protein n=1 Tax=Nocardia sp. SYP-A9097 TaxID=2663237 RepID=UPI00129A426C|nr:hypothetical protein [Nocardia sp. SYP-A9097]MRH89816.1 hypothetical protein [Nocardia sp. SYP-A9097]
MSERSELPRSGRGTAPALSAFLFGMGTLHFVAPKPFDALIPTQLPGSARVYTLGSGAAELAVATAIAVPRTRRLGGLLAMLLFLGVFPGNVKMAADWVGSNKPLPMKAGAILRLPLQIPLILVARKVYRQAV